MIILANPVCISGEALFHERVADSTQVIVLYKIQLVVLLPHFTHSILLV